MVLVLSGRLLSEDRRQAELLVQLHRELEVSYCARHHQHDSLSETNDIAPASAHTGLPADAGRIIQKDLDIAEYTDAEHNPMIPHTIILEPDLSCSKSITAIGF